MATFPAPTPYNPAAATAEPSLTTPDVPPVVGVGSPWEPANGENRDRILDWWRSWWLNVFYPWVNTFSTWWYNQWVSLVGYQNTWISDASAYITANAIPGPAGPNTLPADTAVAGYVSTPTSLTSIQLELLYPHKADIVYRVADYASPQAAIDAAVNGSVVLFPPGNVAISAPLTVNKPLTLRGQGLVNTLINATGCNGIEIAAGQTQVNIEAITIQAAVPYTTTPNSYIGVLINGSNAAVPGYDVFTDVRIIGFHTAIQSTRLQDSRFERIYTASGFIGVDAYGQSENNVLHASQLALGVDGATRLIGSIGVRLNGQVSPVDTTPQHSEGWIITDSLISGGDTLVDFVGVSHCTLANCILDWAFLNAVRITNNGTSWGGGIKILGNYMAMASGAVDPGGNQGCIEISNTIAGTTATAQIVGNKIFAYDVGVISFGIHVASVNVGPMQATGNVIGPNFRFADVQLDTSTHVVTGNNCLSAIANNIVSADGQLNLIANNLGVVYLSGPNPNTYSAAGNTKTAHGFAVPTIHTWAVGDRVINAAPAVAAPKAWVCTVAGTPGTWVSEGNL